MTPVAQLESPNSTTTTGRHRIIINPIAPLALIERADGAIEAMWIQDNAASLAGLEEDDHMLADVAASLESYLHGKTADFGDIPTPRGSEFFQRCWEACRTIARGEVRTYAQLAKAAGGSATAARAAGQAMRRNPLPVIVPCHRVVGSAGGPRQLHGYGGSLDPAGDQLSIKRALLRLEGANLD